MFQPLKSLLTSPEKEVVWHESDLKHLVQSFLHAELKTDGLYCAVTGAGMVTVHVATPTLKQAVRLLEYDLEQLLYAEARYQLKRLEVKSG